MTEIGAFKAKNRWGSLLDCVEQGEEILITRYGKVVARLVPIEHVGRQQAEAAARRIRERARKLHAGAFDWKKLKADLGH